MNIFQGSIYRLFDTITDWAVEGGAILMDHPVFEVCAVVPPTSDEI